MQPPTPCIALATSSPASQWWIFRKHGAMKCGVDQALSEGACKTVTLQPGPGMYAMQSM